MRERQTSPPDRRGANIGCADVPLLRGVGEKVHTCQCVPTANDSNGGQVIRAEGLGKQYGERWAVRDLDVEVGPGEVFGFLGPNGAGKTTTVRMLAGMIAPTEGAGLDRRVGPGRGCQTSCARGSGC